jgi:hypothetical protein
LIENRPQAAVGKLGMLAIGWVFFFGGIWCYTHQRHPDITVKQEIHSAAAPEPKIEAATETQHEAKMEGLLGLRFDGWVALFTAVLAFFTFRLNSSTERLWEEAVRAGKTAEDNASAANATAQIALASIRPWLLIHPEPFGVLMWDHEGNGELCVVFKVKNVGKLVATDIDFHAFVNFVGAPFPTSIVTLRRIADTAFQMPPKMGAASGTALFPDDFQEFNWRFVISKADIEASGMSPALFLELCAVVVYSYPMAARKADTKIIRSIYRATPGTKPVQMYIVDGEAVPEGEIIFSRGMTAFTDEVS